MNSRLAMNEAESDALLIAFTGGGSAGHVTPNLALIDAWSEEGGRSFYIGRANSVEASLLEDYPQVEFCSIPSERLRRYFHWGNFIMPFIVIAGIIKSTWILRRTRPKLLFSKGGFVALPVVIGAWLNRIPVIIHESDGSLGLANRLSLPFTKLVCLGQERAKANVKHGNIKVTGSPLRHEFYNNNAQAAIEEYSLDPQKNLLLVFGGSLGARQINETIWNSLENLIQSYEVIHVVGKGNISIKHQEQFAGQGYHQIEYVREGFADLLSAAHIVICRAGANAVAELIALQKPALLVPLSSLSSRGDQALNASEFVAFGGGSMIENELFTSEKLIPALQALESSHKQHVEALTKHIQSNSTQAIINIFKMV